MLAALDGGLRVTLQVDPRQNEELLAATF